MAISYKSKKEQLVVVSNLTKGGAVIYMKNVVRCLEKKYTITHYSPTPYILKNKSKILNLFSYFVYTTRYLSNYYKKLGITLSLNKEIKKVIIFQDAYIKTPNIFKWLKHKSIYIFHEPPREFYEKMSLHADNIYQMVFNIVFRMPIFFIDRINMISVKSIVSNSIYSNKVLQKIYGKESIVVYPGFENSKIISNKIKERVCISVGSLMGYKGHEMVINSIGRISNKRPKLLIVGGGSLKRKKYLEKLARKNNVKLSILNDLSDSQLVEKYETSHTYVNGSQNEPFGLTSLESIGYGCLLVTNDTGGTKELSKFFKRRVYVCQNNVVDMAKKIVESLSQNIKSDANMKYFSWERVANEIDKI